MKSQLRCSSRGAERCGWLFTLSIGGKWRRSHASSQQSLITWKRALSNNKRGLRTINQPFNRRPKSQLLFVSGGSPTNHEPDPGIARITRTKRNKMKTLYSGLIIPGSASLSLLLFKERNYGNCFSKRNLIIPLANIRKSPD